MTESILNLEIFKGIDKKIIKEIIFSIPERNFITGEIILVENSPSNGEGYIIKSGRVKISIKNQKIAELSAGDIVGEIALLSEDKRTATVETLEDTTMLILTLDTIINMINNDNNSINKEIIRRIEDNLGR